MVDDNGGAQDRNEFFGLDDFMRAVSREYVRAGGDLTPGSESEESRNIYTYYLQTHPEVMRWFMYGVESTRSADSAERVVESRHPDAMSGAQKQDEGRHLPNIGMVVNNFKAALARELEDAQYGTADHPQATDLAYYQRGMAFDRFRAGPPSVAHDAPPHDDLQSLVTHVFDQFYAGGGTSYHGKYGDSDDSVGGHAGARFPVDPRSPDTALDDIYLNPNRYPERGTYGYQPDYDDMQERIEGHRGARPEENAAFEGYQGSLVESQQDAVQGSGTGGSGGTNKRI